ncbi:putative MFS family arabinose efflux permease [Haloactinopolyspora alba]|uniref:Putative MFS family arabinose efflux permease n=1 Tax=Haloactinopolyspora alba TaxID=648780 RepID=A0A2P8E8U0_9ACTN|nr:putative MFS family arabinose efflux permease [Haloactinopolyspora alba]
MPVAAGRGAFTLLLIATLGTFASYSVLLPVVPLWAESGGAGTTGAGSTTGVFMLTTVLTQLAVPALLARLGPRALLVAGGVFMAVSSAAFALSARLWPVVAVSGLRGVGFGLLTVVGSALIAMLLPVGERGRGSALYGLAVGVPNVAGLPAGVWLAEHVGHRTVFVVAAVVAAAGTAAAAVMPHIDPVRHGHRRRSADEPRWEGDGRAEDEGGAGGPGVPVAALLLPAVALVTTALAAGGVVTFLAVAVPHATAVSGALFSYGLASIVGRSAAGVLSDRMRRPVTVIPGVVAGTAGMALLAAAAAGTAVTPSVLAGAGLLGLGFGAVQSDTLITMFHRTGPRGYGKASTVWNVAYDGGFGIGSVGVGVVAALSDFTAAFVVTAAVVLASLPVAVRAARARTTAH